jgi:hypothetical protein
MTAKVAKVERRVEAQAELVEEAQALDGQADYCCLLAKNAEE